MGKQDNVIRLLMIEDSVEDAEQVISVLRNGGIAVRPVRAESPDHLAHQLDRVAGTAHFEVPDERARELASSLARRLPGYLVPRLVREVAGAPHKVPV